MTKCLVMAKRLSLGGTSNKFGKKWDCNLKETKMKCRYLLLEEYCIKLFPLIDNFLVQISGKRVSVCCLVKVRGHLDKGEKEQQRISRKSCLLLQVILILKERFLSNLMKIFIIYSLRQTIYRVAVLSVQYLKISTFTPP